MQAFDTEYALWRGEALVLASKSEGRARILRNARIPFSVCGSQIDERDIERKFTGPPSRLAARLAVEKARSVSLRKPGRLVLGADQVLSFGNEILHKSATREEAIGKLRRLSGNDHFLHSAVALVQDDELRFEHVTTVVVTVAELDAAALDAYAQVAGDALLDSVGGYEIEGVGAQLIERIEGDSFSVIGLPLLPLLSFCRSVGLIGAKERLS